MFSASPSTVEPWRAWRLGSRPIRWWRGSSSFSPPQRAFSLNDGVGVNSTRGPFWNTRIRATRWYAPWSVQPNSMLEIKGLTKLYRNKAVVDDVSFTVRPGEVTGYLG